MELVVIDTEERKEVVLFDDGMKIVEPVYLYLRNLERRGRAFNTIKANGRDLKVYYDFLTEYGYKADEATVDTVFDYVDYLRGNGRTLALYKESALTAQSINRMLSTLRSFYKFYSITSNVINPILVEEVSARGVRHGMMAHIGKSNKVKNSVFKVKEIKRRIHLIDDEDAAIFFSHLPSKRDKLIFKVLYLTGARIQEVLDLKISQIPYPDDEKEICVLEGIKSKGKNRDLYVPMSVMAEIDDFILEERSLVETSHDYLFVANKSGFQGNRLSYHALYAVFKKVSEDTGIELNFHDLRHTFISRLTESGMDISLIRIIAGHEQIETSQKYIHISGKYLKESLSSYWEKSILTGGKKR